MVAFKQLNVKKTISKYITWKTMFYRQGEDRRNFPPKSFSFFSFSMLRQSKNLSWTVLLISVTRTGNVCQRLWFQNPVVLSRIVFEIHFTRFTGLKGVHGDCCRSSESKVKRGKRTEREKATILDRITNSDTK